MLYNFAMKKLYFSPSVMCGDLLNLQRDIDLLAAGGFEYFHMDVMDLNFVPNITLGFDLINQLAKQPTPLDIHLMVNNVKLAVERLKSRPEDIITFHVEVPVDTVEMIDLIKQKSKVGLSLSPDTPASTVEPFIKDLDLVLLMSVYPGFAGQPFQEKVYAKAKEVSEMAAEAGRKILINVDGGIGYEQIQKFSVNGANMFVLGTKSLYKGNMGEDIKRFNDFRQTIF